MKTFLSFFIFIILYTTAGHAQACGGGTYNFIFYSINGTFVKDIRYDFYEVNTDSLKARLTNPKHEGAIALSYFGHHFAVHSIDDILIEEHQNNKPRATIRNKMSGQIRDGKLQVKTLELDMIPVILKITANGKETYYMGNFFGGCYGRQNILLN